MAKWYLASTGGASYGEQETFPATEDHPQYPISPYGVSKLAGERYLHYYRVQYGPLRRAALRQRLRPTPGPARRGRGGDLLGQPAEGRTSTINGSGEQTRDYVFVDDVARANALALERDVPSGAYNVGTAIETSVNRPYEILLEVSGKEGFPPKHGPAKPGEQMRSSVDPTKATRVLGWQPGVDLNTGLEKTLQFFAAP